MNNSKYFVPNIEDLHVGYECEITPLVWYISDDVRKGKLKAYDIQNIDFGDLYVRTPYLTKEQIEAEDWRLNEDKRYAYCFEKHFHYNTYYLLFTPKTEQSKEFLMISHFVEGDHEFMYKGTCPSINEFRKIMSLLEFE